MPHLLVASLAAGLQVVLTITISLATSNLPYVATISEAGSLKAYPIYSSLGVLFSISLVLGVVVMVEKKVCRPLPWYGYVILIVFAFSYAFYSLYKIDLNLDLCAHRIAAGIMFPSGIAFSYVLGRACNMSPLKIRIQRGAYFIMAATFAIVAVKFKQINMAFSVTQRMKLENASILTFFGISQYIFVAALYATLLTTAII